MQTLAFDGRMGASGDMILAALVATGADPAVLDPVEAALPVEYHVETVEKNGISATSVDVLLTQDGERDQPNDQTDSHDHSNDDHSHDDHSHTHESADHHDHSNEHDEERAEHHGPHRTYAEVVEIVESMGLPASVESDAKAIFRLLGEAEAGVHGTDLSDTHFHEVGADDAIADIMGAALLIDDLGPDQIVTTPLATGGGEVSMSHGTYPVPVPAVVEIAEQADWSLRGGPVDVELLTPTGAAILAHYATGVEQLPAIDVDASGYGAGGFSFEQYPNVLRAISGETAGGLSRDSITVLETNLDDATPEELGGLQESLAEVGALDVSILPATMKKSRPGHLVKVIVKPEDAQRVARALARETGTLGVREHGSGHRFVADRETRTVTVETEDGPVEVGVKIASDGEDVFDISTEYDAAAAASKETDLPTRELMRRAEAEAWEQVDGER